MYLFYIDESGNTGQNLTSQEQPIHWICALAVHSQRAQNVERDLADLIRATFGPQRELADTELHGSEIFSGRGPFAILTPKQRVALYESIVAYLAVYDIRAFYCGVDKHRYASRLIAAHHAVHPHILATTRLVRRLDSWIGRCATTNSTRPAHGLLIADEYPETRHALVRAFAQWRSPQHPRHIGIQHLIDTIHYVPSSESLLMQLTDCVTFVLHRYMRSCRTVSAIPHPSAAAIATLWTKYIVPAVTWGELWPYDPWKRQRG